MRLIDLDPRWLIENGKRVGFAFRSPTKREHWQTCMPAPSQVSAQLDLWEANGFEDHHVLQPCNPSHRWTIAGGIDAATFETMTVTPSLDGSAGGLWHGHITSGQIVGGILAPAPEKAGEPAHQGGQKDG